MSGAQDAHAVRWILVHLTPFAPDCAPLAISDDKRWIRAGWATPREAMERLLNRLRRSANQVIVRPQKMGDLGVFAADGKPTNYPLAFIVDGVTDDEARHALMDIGGELARARGREAA